MKLEISPRCRPVLDPDFCPAVLWNRAYQELVSGDSRAIDLTIGLGRLDGTVFHHPITILPHLGENVALNRTFIERTVKFLLWMKGGSQIWIAGENESAEAVAGMLQEIYCEGGEREFDWTTVGGEIFGQTISVKACAPSDLPALKDEAVLLGRNLNGCRIGFDLGGSDRKTAAVIDGEVIFSEEVPWDPYFEADPQYHIDGINHSLQRAAEHLPRVDAIGGSAAGDYVNNEVRLASLFRGVTDQAVYEERVRPIFRNLAKEWGVPFEVINDGEVTALAGSMSLGKNAVLGVAMGTSEAVGYCDRAGRVTHWINELAFAPVDYRDDAPVDEWSGDRGCGVQFFCQQGVARLAPAAGFDFGEMPFPEQLEKVQAAMADGDEGARKIYETIGTCFGYAVAHYADFYDLENLIVLGRVSSGEGGQVMIDEAKRVLEIEFPNLAEKISITTPDEKMKRHGQAVAAASLPVVPENC